MKYSGKKLQIAYSRNIESTTIRNKNYRKVEYTTKNLQLVVMSIRKHEEIGMERHRNATQFIRVESGSGYAVIKVGKIKRRIKLIKDSAIIIPPNTFHNIIAGKKGLKVYTIYSPPQHRKGLIQRIKTRE